MPSLLYYLRRAGEQPFPETLNQARSLLSNQLRSVLQPAYDRVFQKEITLDEVLRRSGFAAVGDLLQHLRARVWPELPLAIGGVRERAEDVLSHKMEILGSGRLELGARIPWHMDIKSGFTWKANVHYRKVPLSPAEGADIKMPWELSRCHHLVTLALAYRETGDEKFSRELVAQVRDWIRENPPRQGVNWVSPMEAGIRATNWCCAFSLIRRSAALDGQFTMQFLQSLHTHAAFIRSNLEFRKAWIGGKQSRLNSNHYLCDLTGLLSIGRFFPELRLEQYSDFAAREFAIEVLDQTTEDGVDYEFSTAYHRFVLEILQYAFELIGPSQPDRLVQMREFAAACLHPDGSLAQVGDNDSGQILPSLETRTAPATRSMNFPEAGFTSMRGRDGHVFISAARVGMHGLGSHSHNDVLSFEYFAANQAWIVDPGTFVYMANADTRNWFRSTAAHNSVRVDDEEIRPFHRESVFQMADSAVIKVIRWEATNNADFFEAEHSGYERLLKPVTHRRLFEFDKPTSRLIIRDTLRGSGKHVFEWFFQIHPDVTVHRLGTEVILSNGRSRVRLKMEASDLDVTQVPGWYSPAYGVCRTATTIVGRVIAVLPLTARTTVEPC